MNQTQREDRLDFTKEEDLYFLRAITAQARRDFDPGTPIYITWGIICFIGYTGTHILVAQKQYIWINWMWWILSGIGITLSVFFGYRLVKQQRKKGFISHIDRQINWIWGIFIANGILWTMLGYFSDWFGGPGFFWALIYAFALSGTGIVYAREWLWGGFAIMFAMILAHFIHSCPYIIIGVSMAVGCILPSIISRKRLKELEKEIV